MGEALEGQVIKSMRTPIKNSHEITKDCNEIFTHGWIANLSSYSPIKKINMAIEIYIRLKAKNSYKLLYILNFLAIKVSRAPWGSPKKTTKLNKIIDKILASVIPISKMLERRKNRVEEVKKR